MTIEQVAVIERGRVTRMALHLIKLCVGCRLDRGPRGLDRAKAAARRRSAAQKPERIHTTRMVPKRVDELPDGGSLYWVIRGQIMCRERILDIRPFVDGTASAAAGWCSTASVVPVRAAAVPRLPGLALSRSPRMRRAISTAPRPAPPRCPRTAARAARTRAAVINSGRRLSITTKEAAHTPTLSISRVFPSVAATRSRIGPSCGERIGASVSAWRASR